MSHTSKIRLSVGAAIVGLTMALFVAPAPAVAHHTDLETVAIDPCVDPVSGPASPEICLNITRGDPFRILNIVHDASLVPDEDLLVAQSVLLTDFNGNSVISIGVGQENGCEMYERAQALLDCEVIPPISLMVTDMNVTAERVGVCVFEVRYSVTLDGQEVVGVNAATAGLCEPGEAVVNT